MIDNDDIDVNDGSLIYVQVHQTDVLDWDETDAGEGPPPPPPQMVFRNLSQVDCTKLVF